MLRIVNGESALFIGKEFADVVFARLVSLLSADTAKRTALVQKMLVKRCS